MDKGIKQGYCCPNASNMPSHIYGNISTLIRARRKIVLINIILACALIYFVFTRPLTRIIEIEDLRLGRVTKRLPQAIIIGCRKGGTRALLRFLEINPAIRAAHQEVHFFDRPDNYRLGLDWYREQMPHSNIEQLTVEKSPAYFITKHVPERINEMNSTVKLIVVFREPVTRLISDFSQLVANKLDSNAMEYNHAGDRYRDKDDSIPGRDIDDDNPSRMVEQGVLSRLRGNDTGKIWLEAEKQLEEYVFRSDGGIDEQRQAVRTGMYSVYLEKWLSIFPRQQLHFVNGDNLIVNPWTELMKLETFLGLKNYIKREHFVFDEKKGFYCLNATLTRVGHRHTRTKIEGAGLEIYCLNRSKGRRHVRLREDLRDKIRDFYEPYNQYLYSLTGIKFYD